MTLFEIITAVAILATLATIVLSTDLVVSPNDRQRYKEMADTLSRLKEAVVGTQPTRTLTSFRWVIGVHPSRLAHLTRPITISDKNICGFVYTSTQVNRWTAPFWTRELLATGTMLVPGFTVQDSILTYSTTTGQTPGLGFHNSGFATYQINPDVGSNTYARDGVLAFRMTNVSQSDAQGLDYAVDGSPLSNSTGVVRYTASDPTTVDYYFTVGASKPLAGGNDC